MNWDANGPIIDIRDHLRRLGKSLGLGERFGVDYGLEQMEEKVLELAAQIEAMDEAVRAAQVFVTPVERRRHWNEFKQDAASRLAQWRKHAAETKSRIRELENERDSLQRQVTGAAVQAQKHKEKIARLQQARMDADGNLCVDPEEYQELSKCSQQLEQACLTDSEKQVLEHLSAAWNIFITLEDKVPYDNSEFCTAMHAAQRLVAVRVARRVDKDVWLQPES